MARLNPEVQSLLDGSATVVWETDEQFETKRLTGGVNKQDGKSNVSVTVQGRWPRRQQPRYCLVECPDGEFPILKIFNGPEDLAKRMADLEGSDVCVWAFYGIPTPFSVGPLRTLLLPGERGLTVEDQPQEVDLFDRELVIQDDGYLGDEDLASPFTENELDVLTDSDDAVASDVDNDENAMSAEAAMFDDDEQADDENQD